LLSRHIRWCRVPRRTFLLQILGPAVRGMSRWLEREEIVWRSVEGKWRALVAPFNVAEIKGHRRCTKGRRRVFTLGFKAMPRRT
ncbi:hypothetical protein DFH09DRAFT_1187914, partial [Mycena vulgaris]